MFGWDDEEHTDAVPHDRFDKASWNEMRMESITVDDMVKRLSQKHDYVESFAEDVYSLLAKADPRVREPEEMVTTHVPLRQVVDELQDMTELKRLRTYTVADPLNATMAVGALEPALTEALERAAKLKEEAEHAAEAQRQAQQAAQQAAESGDAGDQEAANQAAQAAQQAASSLQARAQKEAAGVRNQLRRAVKQARKDIEQTEEAASSYGLGPGELQAMPAKERLALARRLQTPKLKEFADLIGQFRQLAIAEWRRRYTDGSDETVGIILGDDLTRLTGQELINLATPELEDDFWLRYVNRELWVKEMRGRERVGKGPIIVVADESGSMEGDGERWAKALSLALLDQAGRGKRDFHYIGFASGGHMREFDFPGGKADIDKVLELASGFLNGGTDYAPPLRRALDLCVAAGKEKPDIVFITDGIAGELPFLEEWRRVRQNLSVRCYGIWIPPGGHGLPSEVLSDLTDNIRTISDLTSARSVVDILRG